MVSLLITDLVTIILKSYIVIAIFFMFFSRSSVEKKYIVSLTVIASMLLAFSIYTVDKNEFELTSEVKEEHIVKDNTENTNGDVKINRVFSEHLPGENCGTVTFYRNDGTETVIDFEDCDSSDKVK